MLTYSINIITHNISITAWPYSLYKLLYKYVLLNNVKIVTISTLFLSVLTSVPASSAAACKSASVESLSLLCLLINAINHNIIIITIVHVLHEISWQFLVFINF